MIRWMLGAALAMVLALPTSMPAAVEGEFTPATFAYPDRNCTWQFDSGNWPATLNIHYANSTSDRPNSATWSQANFPPASTHEGRQYNFLTRMSAAVSEYNKYLPRTEAGADGLRLQWNSAAFSGTFDTQNNAIVVYYLTNPTPATYVVPSARHIVRVRATGTTVEMGCQHGTGFDRRLLRA